MLRVTTHAAAGGSGHSLEDDLYLSLLQTADLLARGEAEVLKPSGLSGAQYHVLRILQAAGDDGLKCADIGQRLVSRDPDVTRLLDRLEARGLITRVRSTVDRRVVVAQITGGGRATIDSLEAPMAEAHARQLRHLSQTRLRALISLLADVRATGA